MDAFTAANLFIGHATGALILLLFVWLLVSEMFGRRAALRSLRRRQYRRLSASRRAKTTENVAPLPFQ